MKNKKMLGSLMLTLTALIWGTAFVAQRVGMESIEPITFTAARMALAAAATGLTACAARRRNPQNAVTGDRRLTVFGGILCGLFLAAASTGQQMGLVTTTAGKAGFITATYILIVPILNGLLFGKRSPWMVWLAVMIGMAGLYLLCVGESFRLTRGDTLVCVSAFLFSGHILCCGYFSSRADPIRLSAVQFVTVTAVCGVLAFILEEPSPEKLLLALIPILYCGLISGGLGYTLQMAAQRFTDPTVASLLMSLEAVFAAIAGALLLHERMSARELAGCAVMFAAIILVQLPQPRRK